MGNRFYIPPRKSGLMELGNMALQLKGLQQRGEIAKAGQALTEREIASRERISGQANTLQSLRLGQARSEQDAKFGFNDPTLGRFKGSVETTQDIARQRVAATEEANRISGLKVSIADQQYSPSSVIKFDSIWKGMEGVSPNGVKYSNAMKQTGNMLKSFADNPEITNRGLYHRLKTPRMWETVQAYSIDGLQKEYERTDKANPMFKSSPEAKKVLDMIDAFSNDKTGAMVDEFMPAVAKQIANEQRTIDAKFLKTPGAQKAYVGPQGNIAYFPSNQAPPAGYVPYSTGFDIQTSEDGVSIKTGVARRGGAGPGGETIGFQTKVQKDLLQANDSYQRVVNIARSYKPEYQRLGTRWNALYTKWQEKLEWGKVSKEDKAALADYSEYKRGAINNLNLYIKEITGAQMSQDEAARLTRGMPDPGKGLFDGDSETEFKSKMDGIMVEISRSVARLNYVNKHGLSSIKDIPLDRMDSIIDRRGEQIESEIKQQAPGISQGEMETKVKEQLAAEFGLVF